MNPDPNLHLPAAKKAAYQKLLRHPRMVRDLMESLFAEEWTDVLNFQHSEDVSARIKLYQQEGEPQILRIPWHNGENLPLYVLLFVALEPSPTITVRALQAMGALYETLIEAQQIRQKLPPVLPMLIYCGMQPWDHSDRPLEVLVQSYEPKQNLKCLDLHRTDPQHLHWPDGLTALIVRTEQSQHPIKFETLASDLAMHLPSNGDPLWADFFAWWRQISQDAGHINAPLPENPDVNKG